MKILFHHSKWPVLKFMSQRGLFYTYHVSITNKPNHPVSSQSRPFSEAVQKSSVVQYAETILESMHDYTGLPWWLSIVATTCALRTLLTFPVSCYAAYNLARCEALQPEIKGLAQRLHLEVRHATGQFNWTEEYAREKYNTTIRKIVSGLYERDNCHPLKSTVIVLIQLPLWITFSFALRNLSGATFTGGDVGGICESLTTGGTLWFLDLTVADPTFVLPISFVIINLVNIQLNAATRKTVSKYGRSFTNIMRGVTLIMLPVASSMPSCMSLYWSVSSLCGLIQNTIMLQPRFRRAVGIPQVPSETSNPFRDFYRSVRHAFSK